MQTKIFKMSDEAIDYNYLNECVRIIERGGIVGFPTETVYGLGINAADNKALRRLYEIKNRPLDKPLTLHISSFSKIEDFTSDTSTKPYKLIDKFWPGPLTLILKAKAKNETVGLRCPANKIAQELINRTTRTILATSANLSDKQPAIGSSAVLSDFSGKIEAIIDAGKTRLGSESTIVDLSAEGIKFLRIGAIEKEAIEKVLNTKVVLFVCTGNSCRSVMAKALLDKALKEIGRGDIEVIDAGTQTIGNMAPTEFTLKLLTGEGIDMSSHRSSQLTRKLIRKSDLILVMEKVHEEHILSMEPQAKKRLYLLREFSLDEPAEKTELEIVDPIGKSFETYQECFSIIKQSIERLKKLL
ncbi:MAG: L-threonylcarbamoyladenylate synthase [Candidatus Omnitrophota bacterium]